MEIEGFRIEGFANIERASLKVGEQNALIAPNGYGKSNVLRAIEFGVLFPHRIKYVPKTFCQIPRLSAKIGRLTTTKYDFII